MIFLLILINFGNLEITLSPNLQNQLDLQVCCNNVFFSKFLTFTLLIGFAGYANINPFALGIQKIESTGSKFGASKQAWVEKKNLTLTLPSPRSPKHNPFSSKSPVHNPFVTIVQTQDELYQAIVQNKSGENGEKKEKTPESSPKNKSDESKEDKPENSKNEENDKDDDDQDADQEQEDPASPSDQPNKIVPVTTLTETILPSGEENETCLYKGRAKVYRFKTNDDQKDPDTPKGTGTISIYFFRGSYFNSITTEQATTNLEKAEWCEIGTGPIKILCNSDSSNNSGNKERIVMRREDKKGGIGIQLMLNMPLTQYVSAARHGDTMIRIAGINYIESAKLNTYLLRVKSKPVSFIFILKFV